jgi:hypothetical protein
LELEKAQARDCEYGDECDEEYAKEQVSAWGEQKRARGDERGQVKESEQDPERESSLEKRMHVLTERERAYGKRQELEWERESEREREWAQEP